MKNLLFVFALLIFGLNVAVSQTCTNCNCCDACTCGCNGSGETPPPVVVTYEYVFKAESENIIFRHNELTYRWIKLESYEVRKENGKIVSSQKLDWDFFGGLPSAFIVEKKDGELHVGINFAYLGDRLKPAMGGFMIEQKKSGKMLSFMCEKI